MPHRANPRSLRVLSYNILCACAEDEHPVAWEERRDPLARLIKGQDVDLIGLQEPLLDQVDFLVEALSDYAWVGAAREDGHERGELNPILYRRDRFELADVGTFWLSPTPTQAGSVGWDAECPRIVTWAVLNDKARRRAIRMSNTHWDYVGPEARLQSAGLLAEFLGEAPAAQLRIATGDFNCDASEEPYHRLLADSNRRADGIALADSRAVAEQTDGPAGTFPAERNASPPQRKVDHIFVDAGVRVVSQVVVDEPLGPTYPSDHLPVVAELVLPTQG